MSDFAKAWLSAPDEIKQLFIADSRQEWVCPECYKNLGRASKEYYCVCGTDMMGWTTGNKLKKGEHWLQPIPRLEQLVRMVTCIVFSLRYCSYAEPNQKEWALSIYCEDYGDWVVLEADTAEEAVLKGICHEHVFELKEGKWVKD
jgi:hypothetical protein